MSFDSQGRSPEYTSGGDETSHTSPSTAGSYTTQDASAAYGAGLSGSGAAASGGAAGHMPRIRRRNRMITSCLECRRRKLKCDKQHPCQNCTKTKRDCVFLAPALDSASQLKLTEIKEKMGSLERVLEQEVGRNGAWREARRDRARGLVGSASPEAAENMPEDERDLEPTPMVVADAVYDKGDDDAEDELVDLGFAMGKMRLTDRIGGFFRPKFKEEMDITIGRPGVKKEALSPDSSGSSPHSATKDLSYLNPGPTYLPPASTMYFGNSPRGQSLIDFLPAESAANYLIDQYKKVVHPLCKIVHWNTFQRRYQTFWNELRSGIEPVGSMQALIFCAMFSGVVSMSDDEVLRNFAATKKELVDNFQQGAETALARAQFLRTTKLETMQAFIMYLMPLCRDQLSRAHSALVGTAIRLAECMGLHRDGTAYGMSPVEIHVRRMVWHQLCLLDIRTCEAHGPRPGIKEDDYDTKFPLNVDDADLEGVNPPKQDAARWTDMTCTLIRMECNEMMRAIWVDRPRVEKKQMSLTSLIGRIEHFRRGMQSKYFPLMNNDIPIHRAARLILILLTTRMHIMVLHRYHNSVSTKIPERLRHIICAMGLETMEAAIAYETQPELAPYRWFAGALQQYQIAFLLLAEIYANPNSVEGERIWRILDYVFEPPQHLTQKQKALLVMMELRDRMDVYYTARKLRAPTGMLKRLAAIEGKEQLLYVSSGGFVQSRGGEDAAATLDVANQGNSSSPPTVIPDPSVPGISQSQVQAMVGAAGLGQNPMNANMDWGANQYNGAAPLTAPLPPAPAYDGSGVPAQPQVPQRQPAGSGPWQDYPQPTGLPPINVAPASAISDEVMAEIDWAEWDKFFPPPGPGMSVPATATTGSRPLQQQNVPAPTSRPPQPAPHLFYG